jgi:hypothetical protein
MMPGREFADAAEAIDAELHPSFIHFHSSHKRDWFAGYS